MRMNGWSESQPTSHTWTREVIPFRYITETLKQEREPTQVTPLTSSIGSLFSGVYNMARPSQTPSLPQSRSTSPALHISSSITRAEHSLYSLNSPPPGSHSPSHSSDRALEPSSYPQPYSHTERTPSNFQGSSYQRSTSVPRESNFHFSGNSQLPASSTYSGGVSRVRPDGTAGHQSSRSYDSSHSFNPSAASTSRYAPGSSYPYSSQDLPYNNGERRAGHN